MVTCPATQPLTSAATPFAWKPPKCCRAKRPESWPPSAKSRFLANREVLGAIDDPHDRVRRLTIAPTKHAAQGIAIRQVALGEFPFSASGANLKLACEMAAMTQ